MNTPADNTLLQPMEGPAPAMEIALDMVKRSMWLAPLVIVMCSGFGGLNGAYSGAYALAIVMVNFFLSAWLLQVASRISFAAMAGAAGFGFLLRLGLIFVAVMAVRTQPWVSLVPLGITLVVTHLVVLFWELRYVSGSLAFPGLKPNRSAQSSSTPSIERAA